MNIFHAFILGAIQGLAEFIPISSSGHLIIFPLALKWPEQPLVFDTVLHLATAAALIIYFWKDLWNIFISLVKDFGSKKLRYWEYSQEARIGSAIILGSIPAGLVGLLFSDKIEFLFRGAVPVVIFMTLGTILMLLAEVSINKDTKGEAVPDLKKGFFIGIFQSLALFPGMSRSGSTISGGMFLGLNREEATRFSFLLSVPIVVLAGIFEMITAYPKLSGFSVTPIIVGFVTAFITGLLSIRFLLKFLRTNTLYLFIIYRLILAVFLVILLVR